MTQAQLWLLMYFDLDFGNMTLDQGRKIPLVCGLQQLCDIIFWSNSLVKKLLSLHEFGIYK